jgi:hypothetical protein
MPLRTTTIGSYPKPAGTPAPTTFDQQTGTWCATPQSYGKNGAPARTGPVIVGTSSRQPPSRIALYERRSKSKPASRRQ